MRARRDSVEIHDPRLLDEWTAAFRAVAKEGTLDAAQLKTCLDVKNVYLAERLFALFDHDGDGRVDLGEFLRLFSDLLLGGREAKLHFAFRLHDADGGGSIERAELAALVAGALEEGDLHLDPAQQRLLVDAVMQRADHDGDGRITYEEFRGTLEHYPDLYEQMTVSAVAWAASLRGRRRRRSQKPLPAVKRYTQVTSSGVIFVVLYALANGAFFLEAMLRYRAHGPWIMLAHGAGACLNLNGALILVPMLRHLLTFVRTTPLRRVLPVDHAVAFHKLVGHTMFGFALVHTAAHLVNYTRRPVPFFTSLLRTWAGATGLSLLVVFAVMWFFSRSRVRRRGGFEMFFYTHFAFVLWFLLALVHGPVFWQWATLPLLGYALERVWRLVRGKDPSVITQMHVLPDGVTHLVIQKPKDFDHQAGDYVFILMPELARFEWHPFTISSAPEDAQALALHVRSLGNWTRALHTLAERRAKAELLTPLDVYLDGPYGTPSGLVFESEIAVLIGAGIGVTPFASILQSLVLRRARGELTRLTKVYFIWINRGQQSFAWFAELLDHLGEDSGERLIEAEVFLSNAVADLKSTTLNLAIDLTHDETGRDLLTGLRLRTRMGRPDFGERFDGVMERHPGAQVDVFVCGPHALARNVKAEAQRRGFGFHVETF